ncbi:MAG: zinc ABC transporter substrate-binding protein [Pseudohongiella sp.]|nr:MAG: zinc ABC transporter substrate-binding protein [Pseudohongiella sp.]
MPKIYFTILFTSLLCSASYGDVNVVTTIKPLEMIARAVVQDHGSVSSIVDPQQSPHHFSVSPSDRMAFSRADIALWIGPLLETHVSDFFSQPRIAAKTITIIETPELTLHTVAGDQLDAHLWLDSSNAVKIAKAIADRAAELDPANEAAYRENQERFSLNIHNTNEQVAAKFRLPTRSAYGVYHNAYQYFEQQFGLQHDIVILRDPEVQPGIRQIVQLRNEVVAKQPSCLLVEIDSSADLVSTVLNGHELKLITVDLLGSDIDVSENAYSELIRNLAEDFQQCLYD